MLIRSCIAAGLLLHLALGARAERVETIDAFARTEGALCIAADDAGRVVVGDERGAWSLNGRGVPRRMAAGSPVRALVFARDGALWLASDDGLRREEPGSGGLVVRPTAPGAGRMVRDLVRAGRGVLAATAAGLFHVDAEAARGLGSGVPRGDATALAWSGEPGWLVAIVDERVVRIHLDGHFRTSSVEWMVLPQGVGIPVDLARAPEGAWILTERTLLRSDGTTVRPARHPLPAGARPRRLVADGEEVWLATSRGLVRGGREAWRPVGPVGVPLAAIALGAESVWAAGPRGVFKVAGIDHPANAADASMAPIAARPGAWQPPIAEVHRAVVRAHGLEPSRGDRWRRRVAARGRLPEVELRVGYGGQRDRGADTDEAFTSGALRRLHDNDYSRGRDFNVAAVLRWDLGETVYHPEEVDVAKEVREWIELRDEILDEVHQLYYERLRVLAEREALAGEDPQRGHLTIRAAELSAGLDAWTVGWWARALRAGPPAPSAPLSPQPGSVEKRP